MIVSVITYNTEHLKTEQVVTSLSMRKDLTIRLFCIPFKERPGREVLFHHRPNMRKGMHPSDLAKNFDLEIFIIDELSCYVLPDSDYTIIGGCGILPSSFIGNRKIINCHPGLIPEVRGLDAFKWAIFNQSPLGNSLHYIDDQVDAGEHIFSFRTPVKKDDSLEELAKRHYDLEIIMMSNFLDIMKRTMDPLPGLRDIPPYRRMSLSNERKMIDSFEEYKKIYAI